MILLVVAWSTSALVLGYIVARTWRERARPAGEQRACQELFAVVGGSYKPAACRHGAADGDEMRAVHRMLTHLDWHDPRLAKAMLLTSIGGMSVPAVAQALAVSVDTVERDLRLARLLLRHDFGHDDPCGCDPGT